MQASERERTHVEGIRVWVCWGEALSLGPHPCVLFCKLHPVLWPSYTPAMPCPTVPCRALPYSPSHATPGSASKPGQGAYHVLGPTCMPATACHVLGPTCMPATACHVLGPICMPATACHVLGPTCMSATACHAQGPGLPTACPLFNLLNSAATAILLAEMPAFGAAAYVPSIVLGAYACGMCPGPRLLWAFDWF